MYIYTSETKTNWENFPDEDLKSILSEESFGEYIYQILVLPKCLRTFTKFVDFANFSVNIKFDKDRLRKFMVFPFFKGKSRCI